MVRVRYRCSVNSCIMLIEELNKDRDSSVCVFVYLKKSKQKGKTSRFYYRIYDKSLITTISNSRYNPKRSERVDRH